MASTMKFHAPVGIRNRSTTVLSRPAKTAVRQRQVAANALATQVIISGATAASLALGRFVFLPFQRDNVARQGLGKQNDETHPEAGDRFAQEASFALKSNDPAGSGGMGLFRKCRTTLHENRRYFAAGFNAVDVLAWGAIGHAIGYLVLATTSLNNSGFNPKPF